MTTTSAAKRLPGIPASPDWTTISAATIQNPITISGLTPTTIYGFQVQALGVLGYSDWSPIATIICI